MIGISDQDLAKALAENIDAEGNDVGLRAWVASWSPEQRARSQRNLRAWASAARREMKPGGEQRED